MVSYEQEAEVVGPGDMENFVMESKAR